jgi:RNA polymerase sigma-70 factor (ECF subfamily)
LFVASGTPSEVAALHEELDRLQEVLEQLPERYAQVITWAQIDGLGHAEIAERLGISETNSRVLLSRALARLASLARRGESSP